MNLDYVREQINDKEIDVPFARRVLAQQAMIELREVAQVRPVSALLYGSFVMLMSTPDAEGVRNVVTDLQTVLAQMLENTAEMGARAAGHLIPDGENDIYEDMAKDFDVAAAVCRALDLLGWVLAYDAIQPPVFEDETEEEDDE